MSRRLILCAVLLAALAGCAKPAPPPIATVDLQRIQANWPKFINYSNQLAADTAAIEQSAAPAEEKQRRMESLRAQFVSEQNEITDDVREAAQRVAAQKSIKLVLTRQYVGYGGVDITGDVERDLKIVETPAKS